MKHFGGGTCAKGLEHHGPCVWDKPIRGKPVHVDRPCAHCAVKDRRIAELEAQLKKGQRTAYYRDYKRKRRQQVPW